MIRRTALIRSAGIVFCILSVSILGMRVWLNSLQTIAIVNPIESIQWSGGSEESVIAPPRVFFDGEEVSYETNYLSQAMEVQLSSLAKQLLLEDIEQQKISTEVMALDYIDFFAGTELGEYQYGAYRLLRKNGMFRLSEEDYESEIVYLFPDVPINIQGAKGERLLMTTQEVVAWKTEVLEQQTFMERLNQYLTKRRFQEQGRIDIQTSDPTLNLKFHSDWSGWVGVSGVFAIEGCPSIELKQFLYQGFEGISQMVIPLWTIKNIECRRKYIEHGLRALTHLEVNTTKDDGYMYPSTSIWRMRSANCQSSVREIKLHCLQTL